MTSSGEQDLSSFSMMDLFRQETETQAAVLNENLLALEQNPADADRLAVLMRAAHSLKGAARIVNLEPAVKLAHAMEDCFVSAQKGETLIRPESMDVLLRAVDMLVRLSQVPEESCAEWQTANAAELNELSTNLAAVRANSIPEPARKAEPAARIEASPAPPVQAAAAPVEQPQLSPDPAVAAAPSMPDAEPPPAAGQADRTVRVSSDNLNRMIGMMGEYMVQTRWFEPFAASLQSLKRKQRDLSRLLEQAINAPDDEGAGARMSELLAELRRGMDECRQAAAKRIEEFEFYAQQSSDLAERLYREGLLSRMRPFSDGTRGFPRMVRDLARRLDKKLRFEIAGQSTGVDREILEKLEAPLTHLLRNALDHGMETPAEREAAGKNPEGCLTLAARHQAGLLHISVEDDGRGIDLDRVRRKVIDRGLSTAEVVASLSDAELLDFLFLPGFSTSGQVTELSGRGVGLDIVRSLAQEVGGLVRVESRAGAGTSFHLQLPITLSVLRTLLAEIAGEAFAIPLTRIEHLVLADPADIKSIEGRRYLAMEDRNVGLVPARDVLELGGAADLSAGWPIVVISSPSGSYGLVVDRFIGESKLVVRTLDARLGKVQDVSAAALLDDGTPVLILDTEDLVRSVENLLSGGRLKQFRTSDGPARSKTRKHILLAEDSLTVREMERKLLENRGYAVDVAVDGMDAWNAARSGSYDLLISDVDMPRMGGIELVRNIRRDSRLRDLPVMMVSYKDSEEDRKAGLDAGASSYLAKSSFHDESFLHTVEELIGAQ